MTHITIAVLLAWVITAALFVVGERISHARASRARVANRLYDVGLSGSQEKRSGE